MRVKCVLLCIYLVVSFKYLYSQTQQLAIKKSTFGAASGLYIAPRSNLEINQVVGQSSLIGTIQGSNIQMSQGFLHPMNYKLVGEKDWDLRIFPNPTNGDLTISYQANISEPVVVSILSMTGILIRSEMLTNNLTLLQLKSLKSGIYFIKAQSKNRKTMYRKIVLK